MKKKTLGKLIIGGENDSICFWSMIQTMHRIITTDIQLLKFSNSKICNVLRLSWDFDDWNHHL